MDSDTERTSPDEDGDADAIQNAPESAAEVEPPAKENRRLQSEYARTGPPTQSIALGLFGVGALAAFSAILFPGSREVLFALAGTGLFAGVLTYYLTPDRYIDAEIAEHVYAASSRTGEELVAELGLQDRRVYAPARTDTEAFAPVRLFVPQYADYAVPNPKELDSLFVVGDEQERGISVPPSGGSLYQEFERSMTSAVADRPSVLASQLVDALSEGFELVENATADVDPEDGRVSVKIKGSVYGPLDRFDHPVLSFLAVGLATKLDAAVTAEVTLIEDGQTDYLVTCEWDASTTADAR